MKLYHNIFSQPISFKRGETTVMVIENTQFLRNFIAQFLKADDSEIILSIDDEPITTAKYSYLIADYFNLKIDDRVLRTGLQKALVARICDDYYEQYLMVQSSILKLFSEVSEQFELDFNYHEQVEIKELVKLVNVKIEENYNNLLNKLMDYLRALAWLTDYKLIVLVGLKQYLTETELISFYDYCHKNSITILLIESRNYARLKGEKIYTIDQDLCII